MPPISSPSPSPSAPIFRSSLPGRSSRPGSPHPPVTPRQPLSAPGQVQPLRYCRPIDDSRPSPTSPPASKSSSLSNGKDRRLNCKYVGSASRSSVPFSESLPTLTRSAKYSTHSSPANSPSPSLSITLKSLVDPADLPRDAFHSSSEIRLSPSVSKIRRALSRGKAVTSPGYPSSPTGLLPTTSPVPHPQTDSNPTIEISLGSSLFRTLRPFTARLNPSTAPTQLPTPICIRPTQPPHFHL